MRNSENNNVFNFMAFVGFVIIAVLEIISGLRAIGVDIFGATIMNLLNTIKNVCVMIVVGVYAWRFVSGKSKGLKITYFIALIVYIVFTVMMWF